MKLKIGPVLSFRGIQKAEDATFWKVSVLIGIAIVEPIPELVFDGVQGNAPRTLLENRNTKILRYDMAVPLGGTERRVSYGFEADGHKWQFTVPALHVAPRMAYVSCNGFSDPDGMRKLTYPANAVWQDLLCNHDKELRPSNYLLDKEQLWHEEHTHSKGLQRFHLLVMGGDQIYFDSIWEDIPELKEWIGLSREEQLAYKVTAKLKARIENYYLDLYQQRWLPPKRRPWGSRGGSAWDAADAMASIPTVMMWDDHDIFDGWGSYSPEMQHCDLFKVLFHSARQAFWVYQLQHELSLLPPLENAYEGGVSNAEPQFKAVRWPEQIKDDPFALPLVDAQPGFSYGFHIGPIALYVADLRTERSRTQILSGSSWTAIQQWMKGLPKRTDSTPSTHGIQHLLFMSSVPVAHPKLSLAENALDVFGSDNVLDSNADDLNDHWSHDRHDGERKRLIRNLTGVARDCKLRVQILSGDVHVAAWGTICRKDVTPATNWLRLQQLTASAIVHPSLSGVFERIFLGWLNSAASKPQAIDSEYDIEMMLFPSHNKHVIAARNWLTVETEANYDDKNGPRIWATWRCENKDGFSNHILAIHPAPLS